MVSPWLAGGKDWAPTHTSGPELSRCGGPLLNEISKPKTVRLRFIKNMGIAVRKKTTFWLRFLLSDL